MSLRWERVLPVFLLGIGLAGGGMAWLRHRSAPPVPAQVSPEVGSLPSPKAGDAESVVLGQETARALIIGLEALSEMRVKETPARQEAFKELARIQQAMAALAERDEALGEELPLCPEAPLPALGQSAAQPWAGGCAERWKALEWVPERSPRQALTDAPAVLCRYLLVPDSPDEVNASTWTAYASCDEHSDGEVEIYQVGPEGPILELEEPESAPTWPILGPED